MSYRPPNMDDPEDEAGHILSEIMNDSAPIGWERYRGWAGFVLLNKRLLRLMAQQQGYTLIKGTRVKTTVRERITTLEDAATNAISELEGPFSPERWGKQRRRNLATYLRRALAGEKQ